MSDTQTVDTNQNLSNPQNQAAPVTTGDPQGSAPASVDTTATPAPEEGDKPEAKQSRRESRAFAAQRRENRELHRQLGYLQAQMESLRAPSQQQTEGEPAPQQQRQSSQTDIAASLSEQETSRSILERIEDAGEDIEGFDKVMETITARNFPISAVMRDFLGESEKPAQVAKWLSENPKEARRIAGLSDVMAVRALERAEASIAKAKPAPRTTQAPAPLSTVGGSSKAVFDPSKGTMDDYDKWRRGA